MKQNQNEEEIQIEPEKQEEKKQDKKKQEKESNKFSETIENLKKNKNVDSLFSYAQTHTQDTVAYILLLIGILWMFVHSFNGGILVGLVVGFYFSEELIQFFKDFNTYLEEEGYGKTIVLSGGTFALFFMAPGIFIGMAIMTGLKFLLKSS